MNNAIFNIHLAEIRNLYVLIGSRFKKTIYFKKMWLTWWPGINSWAKTQSLFLYLKGVALNSILLLKY